MTGVENLAKESQCGIPTMQLIVSGLQQPLDHDIRAGKRYYLKLFGTFKSGIVAAIIVNMLGH